MGQSLRTHEGTTALAHEGRMMNAYADGGVWRLRLNRDRTTVWPTLAKSQHVGGATFS